MRFYIVLMPFLSLCITRGTNTLIFDVSFSIKGRPGEVAAKGWMFSAG